VNTIIVQLATIRCELAGDFPVYRDFFADAQASRDYGGPLTADRAWRVLALDIGHWALRGFGRWSVGGQRYRREGRKLRLVVTGGISPVRAHVVDSACASKERLLGRSFRRRDKVRLRDRWAGVWSKPT
jgi:hypothetical protein